MTAAAAKRNKLIAKFTEDSKEFDIIGWMSWWSLRSVDLTQEQFVKYLEKAGLPEKYAIEHNYSSAFKRALKNMEEARIIRIVEEDADKIICQFTAEEKVEDGDDHKLEYNPETIVYIDKDVYRETKDFSSAMTRGDEKIRKQVYEHFQIEKIRYNSNDITRYVQKIMKDAADIIQLRDQGCVYFVPSTGRDTMEKVGNLVTLIQGSGSFVSIPMADVKNSRSLVSNAVVVETGSDVEKLEVEIEAAVQAGQNVSNVWKQTRIRRIDELKKRLDAYSEILGVSAKEIGDNVSKLEAKVQKLEIGALGKRKLLV